MLAVRILMASYVAVVAVLASGLVATSTYIAVSVNPFVGTPILLVGLFGLCHCAVLIRWLHRPTRVITEPHGLRVVSPAMLRSEMLIPWSQVELVRFGARATQPSAGTLTLAPRAVPPNVLLRLAADITPDARLHLGLLLDVMGAWPGNQADLPRPGGTYPMLAFRLSSDSELRLLRSRLRDADIAVIP